MATLRGLATRVMGRQKNHPSARGGSFRHPCRTARRRPGRVPERFAGHGPANRCGGHDRGWCGSHVPGGTPVTVRAVRVTRARVVPGAGLEPAPPRCPDQDRDPHLRKFGLRQTQPALARGNQRGRTGPGNGGGPAATRQAPSAHDCRLNAERSPERGDAPARRRVEALGGRRHPESLPPPAVRSVRPPCGCAGRCTSPCRRTRPCTSPAAPGMADGGERLQDFATDEVGPVPAHPDCALAQPELRGASPVGHPGHRPAPRAPGKSSGTGHEEAPLGESGAPSSPSALDVSSRGSSAR